MVKKALVCVVGVPFDDNSSFLFGAAQAPRAIREAMQLDSSDLSAENGLDLSDSSQWCDVGDMALLDSSSVMKEIQKNTIEGLNNNNRIISLGGDHSITYPIISAYSKFYPELSILHIDSHSNLSHSLDGNQFSHISPFARIMEKGLVKRLVQVGIRSPTPHQHEQARRFGVETHEIKTGIPDHLIFKEPVYLSIDMSCLDPAFAPGVSRYEPGGLSTRQLIDLIDCFSGDLVGADLVEFNPERDKSGMTAMVAVKLLKELIARMLR